MRPTGPLHLGNWHGALRNWVELQYQYECFFFIADWHMLTTGYEDTSHLQENVRDVLIDWLAAGLNPGVATLFIQSQVPEHAELHLLLSMMMPLGWLGRVPDFEAKAERAVKSVGGRNSGNYRQLRRMFQDRADTEALQRAQALVQS